VLMYAAANPVSMKPRQGIGRSADGAPPYRTSASSASVITFARRQRRAKKKTVEHPAHQEVSNPSLRERRRFYSRSARLDPLQKPDKYRSQPLYSQFPSSGGRRSPIHSVDVICERSRQGRSFVPIEGQMVRWIIETEPKTASIEWVDPGEIYSLSRVCGIAWTKISAPGFYGVEPVEVSTVEIRRRPRCKCKQSAGVTCRSSITIRIDRQSSECEHFGDRGTV
jgi:hypothetical protein